MKILSKIISLLTALALASAPGLVRAQDAPPPLDDQSDQGASFQTFYDQLGDQGNWVQTDDYGYVFQPNVSDPNWAPYTDGHWVYTDEGWTWVSDEPWGWATYHYGRWANIDGTGWVWVPGYRWAPAWVSWRYGGGYCGWAPLPPETFIGAEFGGPGVDVGIGFHFGGDVDVNFNIGAGCYNFVNIGDMGYPNYRGHFLDRSRNYTIINRTTNITNINVNKTVINNGTAGAAFRGVAVGGPSINEVNAHARQRIQTVQLTAANQPGQSSLQGNSLAVYAPRVDPASIKQARPARVAQTIAHPTFNRGDSITKPLEVTASVRPPAPSAAAIQAAEAAQLHAPAKARIATTKTRVKTPLSTPLTSLQPVASRTATNAEANQQHAQQEKEVRQQTGEANVQANQQNAEREKELRQQKAEADVQANQQNAEREKELRQQKAEADVQANQQHAQEEKEARQQQAAPEQHPQSQVVHEAPAPPHTQAAPVNKPAPAAKPAAAGENKNAGNGPNKQQGP